MVDLNFSLQALPVEDAKIVRKNVLTQEVIELLRLGSHKAFDTVFYALYPQIKMFIKVLTKSEEIADELSQKLFVDLWLKKERLDPAKNFNAYIYIMARNLAFNYLKSKNFRDFYSFDYLNEEDYADFEGNIFAKELDLLVNLTVKRMPSQRKKVYELSRRENKSNSYIAEELNISKKTVEKHLRLAMSDIREVIRRFTMLFFY